MNKVVFLDRDGTINVDKQYVYQIDNFEYLPGVVEALKIFQAKGYLLIIITSQSGIARGYFTENDYKKLDQWIKSDLESKKIHLTASYYCPHLPDALIPQYRMECRCRKPGLGLFERAVKEYEIDLRESYVIGDRLRDLQICNKGCKGFLVGNTEGSDIILEVKKGRYNGIKWCSNLLECANIVNNTICAVRGSKEHLT